MKKIILFFLAFVGIVCGINSYMIHVYPDERMELKAQVYELIYGIRGGKRPAAKLWAHRCDSIEKMQENQEKFEGVELDINYYAALDEFDVSHDKQDKLEYPLEGFLAEIAQSNAKLWLDFKNLSTANHEAAQNRLEYLFAKYNIDKSRAIIESRDAAALGYFHRDGWYTSFYVPVNDKYLESDEGKENFLAQVYAAANTGNVNAVSFPIEYYGVLKSADLPVDLLTWDIDAHWWDYVMDDDRRARLADEQLKVILVTSNSKYNR